MTLLDVSRVAGGYSAHDMILKGVSVSVSEGEMVAILGPNGAGKSTLLKAIAGVIRPSTGTITMGGIGILGLAPKDVTRHGVALVPQEANVFPSLSILENLEMGAYLDRPKLKQRLESVFCRIPLLAERRRSAARTLSGGQRQMLAMGMGLMAAPRVLLLDEPTAGLSPVAADGLLEMARALTSDGVAILIVEQNAMQALEVSDRAYVLVDGKNSLTDKASALLSNPNFREIFLGIHD